MPLQQKLLLFVFPNLPLSKVFVCGRDGFVESWAGPTARAPRKADGSKGAKIQGPLLGLLAAAGYDASEVYKY